ncbi:protein RALF-like 33 [Cucurbita maxima]|uniref:Protein RALF-like 33 n=1 Tax=Cucurbita maxima TaxID=3661 RepID=A0A6J1KG89_CUCMA|nr:protein RALF-like 33 [Cucurbita maxima]
MEISRVFSFLAASAIIAAHFLLSSAMVVDFSGDDKLLFVPAESKCRGSIAECFLAGDDNDSAFGMEFEMDSEINRRILAASRYLSYGALKRNSVPCSRRGASYYNCQPGAQANPYRRGCNAITRCRS